MQINFSFDV